MINLNGETWSLKIHIVGPTCSDFGNGALLLLKNFYENTKVIKRSQRQYIRLH